MNQITMKLQADHLILEALKEDISSEDVTTNSVMKEAVAGEVDLICKQDGIIAGLEVFERVFTLLDPDTKVELYYKDGEEVKNGQLMGKVKGDIRVLLSGERVALNYLQRMSGIATYTNSVAKLLERSKIKLLDTRKTTPNMRIFEKYAVRAGGGYNHRYNLSDGVLLKDNHIGAAGSVTKAVQMAKEYAPFVRKIEVEVENLDMVKEAVEAGADIIMLDNMSPEDMKKAVELIDGRAQTECSGNVTKENIARLTEIGVDYISSGALTHSAPILDISLKNLHAVEERCRKRKRGTVFMTGSERRDQIINQIKKSSIPVSGAQLAKEFDVSRQVIVQDIALIRAAGHEIISTNRGYLLNTPHSVNRIFKVNHTDEELEDELCTVVDLGGKVVNVMVNHRVYGHMEAEINITSRRKVMEFVEDIKRGKSSPLKNITSNYHYHLIEADSEETLDLIEEALRQKKFLVEVAAGS